MINDVARNVNNKILYSLTHIIFGFHLACTSWTNFFFSLHWLRSVVSSSWYIIMISFLSIYIYIYYFTIFYQKSVNKQRRVKLKHDIVSTQRGNSGLFSTTIIFLLPQLADNNKIPENHMLLLSVLFEEHQTKKLSWTDLLKVKTLEREREEWGVRESHLIKSCNSEDLMNTKYQCTPYIISLGNTIEILTFVHRQKRLLCFD